MRWITDFTNWVIWTLDTIIRTIITPQLSLIKVLVLGTIDTPISIPSSIIQGTSINALAANQVEMGRMTYFTYWIIGTLDTVWRTILTCQICGSKELAITTWFTFSSIPISAIQSTNVTTFTIRLNLIMTRITYFTHWTIRALNTVVRAVSTNKTTI